MLISLVLQSKGETETLNDNLRTKKAIVHLCWDTALFVATHLKQHFQKSPTRRISGLRRLQDYDFANCKIRRPC